MKIIHRDDIARSLDINTAYDLQKKGFLALAAGQVIQPPVAHLELPEGSLHMKYGMIAGDDQFVVKHATGFSGNWKLGLPTGDGCIVTFCAKTGALRSILMDQGYLSDLRTALAVRLCAEHFAPECVRKLGVIGTGAQARLAAEQQAHVTGCKDIVVWGRSSERVQAYCRDMTEAGFRVMAATSAQDLLTETDVIVSATSSKTALLQHQPDIHTKLIIAVGADEFGKQELDPNLVHSAARIIADDPDQCLRIGELQHANPSTLSIEALGSALHKPGSIDGLTIVDLTGLAVQDIQAAKAIDRAMH